MVRFGRDGGENRHIQNSQNLRVENFAPQHPNPKNQVFHNLRTPTWFPDFFFSLAPSTVLFIDSESA